VQAGAAAAPVARIVTLPGPGYDGEGIATGFLIHPCLLLTNWHVFQTRSDAQGYAANFHYVRDDKGVRPGKHYELDPSRFFFSDRGLDFALVAVKERGIEGELLSELGFLRLVEATGKVLTGMPVNMVQHPNGGPRQFAISENKLVDILDTGFLQYEADTDRGSSGSPCFNMDWELIGLHHAAVPALTAAGKIATIDGGEWREGMDEDSIHWVANEGARVSFIAEKLRAAQVSPAEALLLQALLASTADPVRQVVTTEGAGAAVTIHSPQGASMANVQFTFTGPVTINQYIGQVPSAQADLPSDAARSQLPPAIPSIATEKSLVFDPDYASRPGYSRKFLGVDIAPPEVADEVRDHLYTVKDYLAYYNDYNDVPELSLGASPDPLQALELRYHHYSLVMNKTAMMCQWTASNVDYSDAARQDGRARAEFGGEGWRPDPRVPPEYQLYDRDIYGPAKRIDRGHIVRREDNCWGDAGRPTEYANSDTYHWTNCTPQHEAFNQEHPKDGSRQNIYAGGTIGLWGHFEVEVAKQIEAGGGKAVLFAGPVLKNFMDAQGLGTEGVKIPRFFWKVVVVRESRRKGAGLLAYGYVFSQEKAVKTFGLTYEGIELPEFSRQRRSLAEIQELASIKFDAKVMAGDQPI
jgi:endonuclease G